MERYEFRWIRGEHVEVFLNGKFQFSADSLREAEAELSRSAESDVDS